MKHFLLLLALATTACPAAMAQKSFTFNVNVANDNKVDRTAVPVIIPLEKYGMDVKSALVTLNGKEIPCQLDDMNQDGTNDELCFVTDINKKSRQTFTVRIDETGQPRQYAAKTFAEMLLPSKKVKDKNKQNIYISCLTVDRGSATPYSAVHHHGPAFENEYAAFRLYFDHRQTVDLYGKVRKGLELKDTQFYPTEQQKKDGYGDDVLWCGNSFGLGALRGWDGKDQVMLDDVDHRTMKVLASGPVRAVVEVVDLGWNTGNTGKSPVNMTTRYSAFSGRRDVTVDVTFTKPATGYEFTTGIVNVKGSQELTDKHGLRGCWGTDWPVALKDSAGHKPETVGLAIYIPEKNIIKELPANQDNYPFVVNTAGTRSLSYAVNFCSDNESFGYHSAKEWMGYLKEWKKQMESPVTITF